MVEDARQLSDASFIGAGIPLENTIRGGLVFNIQILGRDTCIQSIANLLLSSTK
jgi:hypothetical protein